MTFATYYWRVLSLRLKQVLFGPCSGVASPRGAGRNLAIAFGQGLLEPTWSCRSTGIGRADWQSAVSPIGNRRRSLTGEAAAGCQPALQPAASRRYSAVTQLHSLLPGLTLAVCCLVWLGALVQGRAAGSGPAQKQYWESRERFKEQPQNVETAWQFGRACFDLAEFATNNTERAELAEQGIAACQEAVTRAPRSAPAHYYLAMNQGQLARTRSLGALKLVDKMEREFSKARELDERFDNAGPDRNLGYLYRDAPSFGSIGSRSKARHHLERAVALAPEYPDNHLALLEAFLKWGDRNGALRTLKALEAIWPAARQQFSGPAWAASWADWEARLATEKKKLQERSKALESPRGRP